MSRNVNGLQTLPVTGLLIRTYARILTSLALVLVLSSSANSIALAVDPERTLTQAYLRKWQSPQGLPQPTILKIFQSTDGRLWLGTQSGLYTYDGIRFHAARVDQGTILSTAWVQDIIETSDGALWLGTCGQGLLRLYQDQITEFPELSVEKIGNIHDLQLGLPGEVWIASDLGLFRYINESLKKFDLSDGLQLRSVTALGKSPTGQIWVGGAGNRVFLFDGKEFLNRELESLPAATEIREMYLTSQSGSWIGTSHGVLQIQDGNQKLYSTEHGLAHNTVESLDEGKSGSIYVGTRDGVTRIFDDQIDSYRARDGLTQSTACALLEDAEGSLWVGTKNGLNQFLNRRALPLTVSEGLESNDVGPIFQDQTGTIWIGTLGAGLSRFNGKLCSTCFNTQNGLPSNRILSLTGHEDVGLWVGTDLGLVRIVNSEVVQELRTDDGLPSEIIQSLTTTQNGVLWIGTSAGLARKEGDSIIPSSHQYHVLKSSILALHPFEENSVLASTAEGVFLVTTDRAEPLLGNGSHPLLNVSAFAVSEDKNLWISTNDRGIYLMRPDGRFFQFTMRQGLFDEEIFGISSDRDGRLWMACSRGIFSILRSELLDCADGKIRRVTSLPFSPSESLRTVECQREVHPSVCKITDGRYWFSTNHGVLIIDPNAPGRPQIKPNLIIEEMSVNGSIVSNYEPVTFPAGQANVSFKYMATSYISPQRLRYRYQLKGFDADWVDAGSRREAFYTNLPPDDYQFRVSVAGTNGEWTELATPIAFTIPKPFYNSTWFYLLVASLTGAVIWGAFRIRVLQIRAQFGAVMAERMRIARELHDTLIQGFSGVTMQMQALSRRVTDPAQSEVLKDVISDAAYCLKEARRTVAGLRNSSGPTSLPEAIAAAARQAAESHELQLTLSIQELREPVPMELEYHLLRIAQEAIANIVKHSGARSLEVHLEKRSEKILLRVKDDGRGFQVDGMETRLPGHYGLIGMRERALQIHALLDVSSRPGAGTLLRVEAPIRQPATSFTAVSL